MSTEDEKWNLDRIPTKWERFYGSMLSVLIFILISLFLYASFLDILENEGAENAWPTFFVAALLFIGSGYLLLRVVFGKRHKPSVKPLIITGYVIGAMSCLLLVVSGLGLGNTPYLAVIGLTGLAGSSEIIKKVRHRGNS